MSWVNYFSTYLNIISVEEFNFKFDSLVDANGKNIGLQVVYEDLQYFYDKINLDELLSQYPLIDNEIVWFNGYIKKKNYTKPNR